METLDEARYKVEPEPYGNFVATPAGVRASLDDPERKENPARLSVTKQQEISRLDSRTLHPINALNLLVFSNNIKNVIIERRIMALESWAKGHPRSLKMTPFYRPLYNFLVVCHIAISCTTDVQNIVKSWLGVTQNH